MSNALVDFLCGEPEPDESPVVRLAMCLMGVLTLLAGFVAAVRLHWAALPLFGFSAVSLYAWWLATHQSRAKHRVVRLTPMAAQVLTSMVAREADPQIACLRIELHDDQFNLAIVTSHDRESDVMMKLHGIRIVVARRDVNVLRDTEIDFCESEMGSGFRLRRPDRAAPGTASDQ